MRQILVSTIIVFWLICLPQTVWALVNINTASSAELQSLTGIGTVIAGRIVDYRNQNGQFQSIEAVKNVSGIGTATYDKIKNNITVSEATTVTTTTTESKVSSTTSSLGSAYIKAEKKVFIPVSGLIIRAPGIAYVNQPVYFDVSPENGTNDRLVRYTWNFGDGTTDNQKSPIHHYEYSGTYVVTVESYYLKEFKTARYELTVFPVNLKITTNSSEEILIYNAGEYEIDLQGMILKGTEDFVFPKYTILLPGKTLTLKNQSQTPPKLYDNQGQLVGTKSTQTNFTVSSSNSRVVVSEQTALNLPEESEIDGSTEATSSEVDSIVDENTATAINAKVPSEAWPYLGLIGLILIGLLAVYGTKGSVG